ncbi:hypothetical protein BDB00DRAFT_766657 [Zychaea mexicana]|uniref:uncharacterized protein n=1 Tax=Zychaea mexicana TaxID=64656 RepID=UPI0022FF3A35|nr:uncharacterized protein BDB00DRAFT_766657 [Zychaea mexicana]KAI9491710.1 hypothetical protein BDB00DRAFT_766657 [Zychaea mexicana]
MQLITSSVVIVLGYFAASAAAADCNPSYNVTAGPECISNCRQKAGSAMWSDYTTDPTSPNYIESLSYECVKGTPTYTTFMTQSGICMMSCSSDDQADYGNREHTEACAWYTEHSSDTCAGASGSGSTASASGSDASASGSDSSEETTDESAANSVKMGSLMVSVAAAGVAALLL